MKHDIRLTVNGDTYTLAVEPWRTLNEVLREDLNLTGTKLGCGSGDCGACTVMVDGKSISSCLTLAVEMDGKTILTVEGLAPPGRRFTPSRRRLSRKEPSSAGSAPPGWRSPP
jgi:carbon-monoxide dehydrogenase small subunit